MAHFIYLMPFLAEFTWLVIGAYRVNPRPFRTELNHSKDSAPILGWQNRDLFTKFACKQDIQSLQNSGFGFGVFLGENSHVSTSPRPSSGRAPKCRQILFTFVLWLLLLDLKDVLPPELLALVGGKTYWGRDCPWEYHHKFLYHQLVIIIVRWAK